MTLWGSTADFTYFGQAPCSVGELNVDGGYWTSRSPYLVGHALGVSSASQGLGIQGRPPDIEPTAVGVWLHWRQLFEAISLHRVQFFKPLASLRVFLHWRDRGQWPVSPGALLQQTSKLRSGCRAQGVEAFQPAFRRPPLCLGPSRRRSGRRQLRCPSCDATRTGKGGLARVLTVSWNWVNLSRD